jgi:hypothetical protein
LKKKRHFRILDTNSSFIGWRKYFRYYKIIIDEMKVNESYLSDRSEQSILGFFLNENRRESTGEMCFDCIRNDFFYNFVKSDNYWIGNDNGTGNDNFQRDYCFHPNTQSDDIVNPSNPNPPNYEY